MKKFSTLTLLGLLLLIAQNLFSVPAVPWPVEKQLSDGTTVSVYLKGDEKVHWMESLDGYTLLYNDSQDIVYAQKDADGDLVPSAALYGKSNPSAEDIRFISSLDKGLRYSPAQVDILKQIWEIEDSANAKSSTGKSKVLGDKKALCILMNFSNKTMGKTKAQFENLMNQVGFVNENGSVGSVKDFYRENSYNKMDLTITVVGPYTTTNTSSYYGNQNNYWEFARQAINAADADVDYTEFANENNQLETVHIIFAGYGDEAIQSGQQIWSHKSELTPAETLDGVRIAVYSCSPELRNGYGTSLTGIGVICHELCHVFGADDYYDTDYQYSGGNYPATGEWDLMAEGSWNSDGDKPAHINMFQKILYEWVEPIELTEPTTITDMPNSAENAVAYIVKPYTNNEQYVLENRQQVGFDSNVPGKGLLVYHVHNSAANGNINNRSHPQQVYVVAANSSVAIPTSSVNSYGNIKSSRAPFASVASLNEFSKESVPAMFRWNGTSGTVSGVADKPLTNITQNNGLVSFDFMGGNQGPCQPVQNLEAELTGNIISLSWEKPKEIDEYGEVELTYSVYMNNELIVEGLEDEQHTITLSGYGNYNCCVIAVSDEHECESESVCKLVEYPNPFNPVTKLTATQEGKNVIITWVAPVPDEGMSIDHYKLYRDETLIASPEPGQTEYTDVRPEPGTYTYSILTYYNNTDVSDPVNAQIVVSKFDECKQIPEISATIVNNTIVLNWNKLDYILAYDVYKDGERVAESISATSYTDVLEESGSYIYGIVSYGEECLSEPETITVDFVSICDKIQIANLDITRKNDTIRLDWIIESDDDSIKEISFFEGFEDGANDWTLIDADEDTFHWELSTNPERIHAGNYSMVSLSADRSGALQPNNWLISPAITIGANNYLSYWQGVREGYEGEHYAVYLSTTDREPESFKHLIVDETVSSPGWQEQVFDLGEYEGQEVYIAFRHFESTDKLALFLDDISIFTYGNPKYNVYENGTLVAEAIEDNFFEKELTKSGTYTFEVTYVDYCESASASKTIDFIHSNIDNAHANNDIRIYPTVTDGKLTVETPSAARIMVKDVTGRTLAAYDSTGQLDITLDYVSGVYLVVVESADKTITSKIILK